MSLLSKLWPRGSRSKRILDTVERMAKDVGRRLGKLEDQVKQLSQQRRETDASAHLDSAAGASAQRAEAAATLQLALQLAPTTPSQTLISVIVPVRNRAALVEACVRSLFAQSHQAWEALIVDDSSTDDSLAVAQALAAQDPRVRVLRSPGRGAAAARNQGLAAATGAIVTYLDSDNTFQPRYLASVAALFDHDPSLLCGYTGQLVESEAGFQVRWPNYDAELLRRENFIDLNALVHRREGVGVQLRFDEKLKRLIDWDFVLQWAALTTLRQLPALAGVYDNLPRADRITLREPMGPSWHQVWSRHSAKCEGLRVLFATPELTTQVQSDLAGARALGVKAEVWSEQEAAGGDHAWATVIEALRPQVVHAYGAEFALKVARRLGTASVPLTARCSALEGEAPAMRELATLPQCRGIYLPPKVRSQAASQSGKLRQSSASFVPSRYAPVASAEKDRRLVVLIGASLLTSDSAVLREVAKLCPDHRFVACVTEASEESRKVSVMPNDLSASVEVHTDLTPDGLATWIKRAGLLLHGLSKQSSVEPSDVVVEAMATGAVPIVRELPGARHCLGNAGLLFQTPEEAAAHIRATMLWSDSEWRAAWTQSVDRAWTRYPNDRVMQPVVEDWLSCASAVS